jgi:hypothetical protein
MSGTNLRLYRCNLRPHSAVVFKKWQKWGIKCIRYQRTAYENLGGTRRIYTAEIHMPVLDFKAME